MGFRFSARSLRELKGIHSDLRKVTDRALALSPVDFIITDGLRTIEEQRAYVRKGVSKTLKSRHLTGHAVDFVAFADGKVSWDFKLMKQIGAAFKQAAQELKIPVVWGGDWKSFVDTPHVELDRRFYK